MQQKEQEQEQEQEQGQKGRPAMEAAMRRYVQMLQAGIAPPLTLLANHGCSLVFLYDRHPNRSNHWALNGAAAFESIN